MKWQSNWYMVTPIIFYYLLNQLQKEKKILSLILFELQKRKNRQMLCIAKVLLFGCAVSLRLLKVEFSFPLAIDSF